MVGENVRIKPQRYRLSFVLTSVFFPLTEPDFSNSLQEKNFTLGRTVPPIFPSGERTYVGGRIAVKDDCVLEVDANRKLVGIEGLSSKIVIAQMEELLSIVKKEFHVNLKKDLAYLELIANLIVTSEKNPLHSIAKFSRENVSLKRFEQILGPNLALYSLAIVPEDVPPNSPKWFDIRINPHVTATSREYYGMVVFRDREVQKVLDFARDVDSKMINLVKEIERG